MFDQLSQSLENVFGGLRRRASLREQDIENANQEIRRALLEADVALNAVKAFFENFAPRTDLLTQELAQTINPADELLKRAQNALARLLGEGAQRPMRLASTEIELSNPPTILLAGLQGSGKTTTAVKLAFHLQKQKHNPLLVSLDFSRPAAEQQLLTLAQRAKIPTILQSENPENNEGVTGNAITNRVIAFAKHAKNIATKKNALLICDTAGRMQVDEQAMDEIASIAKILTPRETLLVADAMLGQEAANIAESFKQRLQISGIILTRLDGDARAGAALSMMSSAKKPVRFAGTGESIDALEKFDPNAIASRILGRGDLKGLVEKMQKSTPKVEKTSEKQEKKDIAYGKFNLNAHKKQIQQMRNVGGLEGLAKHLPKAMQDKINNARAKSMVNADKLKRQEVIINAMTRDERKNPKIIHASRKKRIASGASATIVEVNRLLKNHASTAKAMKTMAKWDDKALQRNATSLFR